MPKALGVDLDRLSTECYANIAAANWALQPASCGGVGQMRVQQDPSQLASTKLPKGLPRRTGVGGVHAITLPGCNCFFGTLPERLLTQRTDSPFAKM